MEPSPPASRTAPATAPATPIPAGPMSSFLVGLRAARANLVPGLCLQALLLLVVFAYYRLAPARPWFDRLGALKQSMGYGFTVVSAILAGALLPEVFKWGVLRRRWPVWREGGELLFAAGFYTVNALCVDCFYRWQTVWFGAEARPAVLVAKVAVDQFVYNPVFAAPFAVACFAWRNGGYTLRPLAALCRRGAYVDLVLPTLEATWIVWLPVVAILYSLPPLLQIPVYSLALCFWSLMLTYIHANPDAGR